MLENYLRCSILINAVIFDSPETNNKVIIELDPTVRINGEHRDFVGPNYLLMRAKQLNDLTSSERYSVQALPPGRYHDGYGRKVEIFDDNNVRVHPIKLSNSSE